MRISELINRLAGIREQYGDIQVLVGETNSMLHSMLDINVDHDVVDGEKFCIIQAYIIKSAQPGG